MPVPFDQPDKTLPLSDALTVSEVPVAEAEGSTIGRYKLLQVIGEGGFGVVYMAEQMEPVVRRVALKVIKLGMDTRQVIARFEAERQALAMMDHPNIAKVLDAGATELGRPYFVMELVKGVPITKYCEDQKLSTEERLRLFLDVCQAIQHAHQKGIIHRDIKPSNILVTLHDGKPVPKVIDFGIAKATQAKLTDKTLFTRYEQIIGTPAYMSPEQAEMSGLDIDTRSDIYSLGVLLYELLTGATPFDTKQLLSAGFDEMRRIIREEEPIRPSTRIFNLEQSARSTIGTARRANVRDLSTLFRRELDWIVLKAIEKDRTRRYETAEALKLDVQRHLDNEPVLARPPTTAYRLQKAWRRNEPLFLAGFAVTTTLLIGSIVATYLFIKETHASRAARKAETEQARLRELADQATAGEKAQRVNAERVAEQLRENLYVSEMSAAFNAWEQGRLHRARELLDHQRQSAETTNDLRGFEWRFLWKVSRPAEVASVNTCADWALAISPDGQTLAGRAGGYLRLWDSTSLQPVTVLATNIGWSFSMTFSSDNSTLVSSHGDSLFHWDVRSRALLREMPVGAGAMGVSFGADRETIAVATGTLYSTNTPGKLAIWNLATGDPVRSFEGIRSCAYQPVFSPDYRILAVSTEDGTIYL